jgi:hypothetical protein
VKICKSKLIQPLEKPLFQIRMNGNLVIYGTSMLSSSRQFGNTSEANYIKVSNSTNNSKTIHKFFFNKKIQNYHTNVKCVKCHKISDGPYINSCFHRPFCQNCFNEIQLDQCCPLCTLESNGTIKAEDIETDEICSICQCEVADSMLLSCKHRFCSNCIKHWKFVNGTGCMICRNQNTFSKVLPKYQF